jgi:hypothetical protein
VEILTRQGTDLALAWVTIVGVFGMPLWVGGGAWVAPEPLSGVPRLSRGEACAPLDSPS